MAIKKGLTTIFFHPSLLLLFLVPGSGIRDLGSEMGKNQDPGAWIISRIKKNPGSATLVKLLYVLKKTR
jgi:hypothetical protein